VGGRGGGVPHKHFFFPAGKERRGKYLVFQVCEAYVLSGEKRERKGKVPGATHFAVDGRRGKKGKKKTPLGGGGWEFSKIIPF